MKVFFVFAISFLMVTSSLPIPSPQNSEINRIVNGFDVDIKEVPYQASLRRKIVNGWAHSCGAVVISDRAVLTAAHCVSDLTDTSLLRIVVGTSSRLSAGVSYEISRIYNHEAYSNSTLENDIALLVTAKAISFGETVRPIALPPSGYLAETGMEALVSGFGTVSSGGAASSTLQAAKVNIVSHAACLRAYLRITPITAGMICAHGSNPPRDACQGDSGGPLVGNEYLLGIVSWGEGCAGEEYPGVYTRVSEYNLWVEEKLEGIY